MALNSIAEADAVLAMRIAQRDVPDDIPPAVQYVNGRVAQDFEWPHLAAGIRRERAEGASAVAGLTGGRK